jgi:hypothetical protein
MTVVRRLALGAIGALLLGAPAWAQTTNARIAPQTSSITNDGARKVTGQQNRAAVEEAGRAAAAKKKAPNPGVGGQLKPLQRP